MRPLRIEIFDAHDVDHKNIIYDIFNFRTGPIDPKIFDFPDLTLCKPSQSPKIPDFPEIFHMKMEVKVRVENTKSSFQKQYIIILNRIKPIVRAHRLILLYTTLKFFAMTLLESIAI